MEFDLDARRARLSVGELSGFGAGAAESSQGASGLWRAQLGTHWHTVLRGQAAALHPDAEFEVSVAGEFVRRGWTIALEGRIDQLIRTAAGPLVREIKTVVRPLPEDAAELRADYPAYFVQLAAYTAMLGPVRAVGELAFVEVSGGLVQAVALEPDDHACFQARLEAVADFLGQRRQARDRRLGLRFHPPFASLRPGQETVQEDLAAAFRTAGTPVLLEAPTGFGKTGALLEFGLGRLRSGEFDRLIYLTGKATGQLQVTRTLETMLAPPSEGLAIWTVRPKSEHCVNHDFHCLRPACRFLDGMAGRWPASGLDRHYLLPDQPRDLDSLRAAGAAALVCPYEITRAALAFSDLWIGDYNYVFAPSTRSLFYQQPGFDPRRTLLVVDEAHNLASRVAGCYSHELSGADAAEVCDALAGLRMPPGLALAWDAWSQFLQGLGESPALAPEDEAEARQHIGRLAGLVGAHPLDYVTLGPRISDLIWNLPALAAQLESGILPLLWWSPRPGRLSLTCLNASAVIGPILREFAGVILATATPGPAGLFAETLGLDGGGPPLAHVEAATPWRDGAYEVACDLRVDTRFRSRARYCATTADTVAALCRSRRGAASPASPGRTAVFFPSYAYAETVAAELSARQPDLRVAVQPRRSDLSSQEAWVRDSLEEADAMFLILGSSFAESIDLLGGRVGHAMVVGPALPEVNAVQRARQAALVELGFEAAFHRVYQVPGIQKVNQALGRLVRAPGQSARILLHCRRFGEADYRGLLAPDYRHPRFIRTDADLSAWTGLEAESSQSA